MGRLTFTNEDARLARSLLGLMAHRGAARGDFRCELSPLAFETTYPELRTSTERTLGRIGLQADDYLSKSADGKVAIYVPRGVMNQKTVQVNIGKLLPLVTEQAAYIGG